MLNIPEVNQGGRPPKWKTVEELRGLIEQYITDTIPDEITLTGLCLALNTNKQTLANYESKEGFNEVIKWGKLWVEHAYELSLRKHGRSGDIFALKNFGWTDKQEIETTNRNINYNKTLDDLPEDLLERIDSELERRKDNS